MSTPPLERIEHSNDHVTFIHKDVYIPGVGDTPDHRLIWFSCNAPMFRRKWVLLRTLGTEGETIGEHFVASLCTDEQGFQDLLNEVISVGFDKYKYITYAPDAPETVKLKGGTNT